MDVTLPLDLPALQEAVAHDLARRLHEDHLFRVEIVRALTADLREEVLEHVKRYLLSDLTFVRSVEGAISRKDLDVRVERAILTVVGEAVGTQIKSRVRDVLRELAKPGPDDPPGGG